MIFQRIQNEWPLRSNGDTVTRYVQDLGLHLARIKGYDITYPWRFSVVRHLDANAFSIGGGYVFITEGAINFSRTESELAAILAHEIGHEVAGHFCKNEPPDFVTYMTHDLFTAAPPPQHRVGVGSLMQVIDVAKEQQADNIALSIIQQGGFDPYAMVSLARRLPRDGSTHLVDMSRLQALEQQIFQLPPHPVPNSSGFEAAKQALATQ